VFVFTIGADGNSADVHVEHAAIITSSNDIVMGSSSLDSTKLALARSVGNIIMFFVLLVSIADYLLLQQ